MPLRLAVSRHDSHGMHVIKYSTGVTHATIVYWEYWDIIRTAAEPKCSYHIQKSIETIDRLLSTKRLAHPIKALFGLPDLQHDEDFVSLLEASDFMHGPSIRADLRWRIDRPRSDIGRQNVGIRRLGVMYLTSSATR